MLMPGEVPVYLTTLHWIIYVRGLVMTLLGLALHFGAHPAIKFLFGETALEVSIRPLSYIILGITVLGCLVLFSAFIRQASFSLMLTNRRVVAKYGIVSRTTIELVLSKIEGANLDQPALGRLLGYGNIWIKGVGDSFAPIYCIADPQEFQNVLLSQINQATNPNGQGK